MIRKNIFYCKMITNLNENKKPIHHKNEVITRVQETGVTIDCVLYKRDGQPQTIYRSLVGTET
jgi:hypothetical protein